MTLKELIQHNAWLSVKLIFVDLYPDQEKSIEGYEIVYSELQIMQPAYSKMLIQLKEVSDEFDNEHYVDVSGVQPDEAPSTPEINNSYALEFTPWAKWLGMQIDDAAFKKFTEPEILSYILYEMTFAGFDETAIQKQKEELDKQIEAIENMTEEEKKKEFISWEEVKKKFFDDKKSSE
ncbi:MAG: DUF6557 family protein [Parafilimonas sp.]